MEGEREIDSERLRKKEQCSSDMFDMGKVFFLL